MLHGPTLILPGIAPAVWSHQITAGQTLVGRSLECRICLDHWSVLHVHAILDFDKRGSRVATVNGGRVLVNERVVTCAPFVPGDVLTFGRCVVEVFESASGRLPPAADGSRLPIGGGAAAQAQVPLLSEAEQRVVDLVLVALPVKAVAQRLNLSPLTVHTHLKNVYRKLGIHSRVELAMRLGRSHPVSR
jgi:DNA-binding CsgD family transcriptional regulator